MEDSSWTLAPIRQNLSLQDWNAHAHAGLRNGKVRPTTAQDMLDHIILIDACNHIHNSQMDIWPNDIPMTTIHAEAIWAWRTTAINPTAWAVMATCPLGYDAYDGHCRGGKDELQKRPRFFCHLLGSQPAADGSDAGRRLTDLRRVRPAGHAVPEAIAGMTAPVTLAGLVAQENAAILAHITLAQIFRPGTPVLYGTVSTTANMRYGTVTLGAMETGLITAASTQMARFYGLPIRSGGRCNRGEK